MNFRNTVLKQEVEMLLLILGAALGLYFAPRMTKDSRRETRRDVPFILFVIVAYACVGVMVGALVARGVGLAVPSVRVQIRTTLLANFEHDAKKRLFLGVADFNNQQPSTVRMNGVKFYVYYPQEYGGSTQDTLRVRAGVSVIEEDRDTGELHLFKQVIAHKLFAWVAFVDPNFTYEFRIPRGSMKRSMKIS